jgi:hypothetical protein
LRTRCEIVRFPVERVGEAQARCLRGADVLPEQLQHLRLVRVDDEQPGQQEGREAQADGEGNDERVAVILDREDQLPQAESRGRQQHGERRPARDCPVITLSNHGSSLRYLSDII